jgi:hypothetical protein
MHNVGQSDRATATGEQGRGHVVAQADAVGVDVHSDGESVAQTAPPAERPHRSLVFRTGLVVLITVTAVWRYWTLSSWSWFQDDWIYLTRAAELPFWQYVTQNYNGHVMPGQFVVAWVITKAAPLDYSYAVATTLLLVVASLLAWAAALRTIFGERARLLYPLIILALSPLFMPISLWWAAALQVFPLQLSMGLSVLFVARCTMYSRRRDVVGLALSYGLGVFFWQKSLLVMVPIVFVALLLSRGTVRERVAAARRALWAPLAITTAYVPLYILLTRVGDAAKTELFEKRGFAETVSFFLTGILDVGMPALAGGPWAPLANPQQVFTSGSGVLTLAFLTVSVLGVITGARLRHRGALALSMTAFYAAASWGLLFTSSRFEAMGLYSVRDARYAADILPVALLTVAFLIAPTLAEDRSAWLRQPISRQTRSAWRKGSAALVTLISISALWANGRIWDASAPSSPKVWVDNVTADARSAGSSSVYDSMAPGHVILSAYFWGDGALSRLLKPLSLPLRYNEPADQLLIADWAGHLKEVDIEGVSRSSSPPPVEGCGYLVEGGKTTIVPMSNRLYNWQWGYQVDYFGGQAALVTVHTDSKSIQLRLKKGLNHVQFVVEDSVSRLTIEGHPDSSPVCVTEVRAGPLKASGRWIGSVGRP